MEKECLAQKFRKDRRAGLMFQGIRGLTRGVAAKRPVEGIDGEPLKVARNAWDNVPAGTVEINLDDSQPLPENTAG